jgi:hypothetical protein
MGPLFVGAGAGALICVVGATMGLGVAEGMLGEASSAGDDATGTLGERVSLVGIGARILDTEGMMSEVGTAGYPEDTGRLDNTGRLDDTGRPEDTAGVSDGTTTGLEAALLCSGTEEG